jgi:hypothetical protein
MDPAGPWAQWFAADVSAVRVDDDVDVEPPRIYPYRDLSSVEWRASFQGKYDEWLALRRCNAKLLEQDGHFELQFREIQDMIADATRSGSWLSLWQLLDRLTFSPDDPDWDVRLAPTCDDCLAPTRTVRFRLPVVGGIETLTLDYECRLISCKRLPAHRWRPGRQDIRPGD